LDTFFEVYDSLIKKNLLEEAFIITTRMEITGGSRGKRKIKIFTDKKIFWNI